MVALNRFRSFFKEKTHEGAPAARMNSEQALRRSVLSCLLWEDEFYESGEEIAARIVRLCSEVAPDKVAEIALEARSTFNLRHVPLLLLAALAKNKTLKADMVCNVIQRADELAELLAIHAKLNGVEPSKVKKTIPAQMKKGLARAFTKFDEYQIAKYDRDGAVRLRDVLFLCHAKPSNDVQAAMWKRLIKNELSVPDTWEVALSGGADKKEAFTRLLAEKKLGYFALLRNLRNMTQAGVDIDLIKEAIIARKGGADRVLPFRYVAAARACPQLEPEIDRALCLAIAALPAFSGKTTVLVDVSDSMNSKLSAKSDMTRMDAACALASMIHGARRVFSFSNRLVECPPRLGMAGVDAIRKSQEHASTQLGGALADLPKGADRLIVITDEQSHDKVGPPGVPLAYMINVASNCNGVGYGAWTHIDGFSEGVLRFIHQTEMAMG